VRKKVGSGSKNILNARTQIYLCMLVSCILVCSSFPNKAAAFAASPALPDSRVYEMVTPVSNHDADVYVPEGLPAIFVPNAGEIETRLPFRVATNGEAVAYVGDPTTGGTGSSGLREGNEYLVRRSSSQWEAPVNIQPPGVGSAFYEAFSPDLTEGILEAGSAQEPETPPLNTQAPDDGYATLYTRALSQESYRPLFTVNPPNRTPAEFRSAKVPGLSVIENELVFAGTSADFSHLFFEANDALTSNAIDGGPGKNNLYMDVNGKLTLINLLPDGSTEAGATFGAPQFETSPNFNLPDFSNVISPSGSRVLWTDLNSGKEAIYLTENAGSPSERSIQVDASHVPGSKGGGGRFWTASDNGLRVIFTDSATSDLTPDTQSDSGTNLYEYEVPTGQLIDLTAVTHAEVEGVLGQGETKEGQFSLYFVAKGVLSSNKNSYGVEATPGADNLYVLQGGGSPIFVAALSPEDGANAIRPLSPSGLEEFGDWQPGLGHRTAEVTSNGEALTFMSNNQNGDGQSEEVGGRKLEEVYVFEAEDAGPGKLFCASCGDGIEPQVNPESEDGLGAFLPVSWSATYLPQVISEDGSKVFFDSAEPLVPQDTNEEQDVYEWERGGSGECRAKTGCIYLLSGGLGATSSWLVGVSNSGNDAFFITRAQLVPTDTNEVYNLYDARVDGTSPILAPACTETGCQGLPASPPVFAAPPTVTFEGVGNKSSSPKTVKPSTKIKTKTKGKSKKKKKITRKVRTRVRRGAR
jgi:hypothetical protein